MTTMDRFEALLPDALADLGRTDGSDLVRDVLAATATMSQRGRIRSRLSKVVEIATPRSIFGPLPASARFAVGFALMVLALAIIALVSGSLRNESRMHPGGTIFVWEPGGDGGDAYLAAADGTVVHLDLSAVRHSAHYVPDRHGVAFWAGDTLMVRDPSKWNSAALGSVSDRFAGGFWSPDGRAMAIDETTPSGSRGGAHIVDLVTGSQVDLPAPVSGYATNMAWTLDSRRVAIAWQVGAEVEIDTVSRAGADRRPVTTFGFDRGLQGYPELIWSPDQTIVAWRPAGATTWHPIDVARGVELPIAGGVMRADPAFWSDGYVPSPDGDRIAFVSGRTLVIQSIDGSERVADGLDFAPGAIAWSPDSKHLAVRRRLGGIEIEPAAGSGPAIGIDGVPPETDAFWKSFGWYDE